MGRTRYKKKRGNATSIVMTVIVLVFLGVMTVQIYKLKQQDEIYAEKEEELKDQIAQEEDRASELEEMDLYTKSIEYIKDMANRLGLIFGNEIIFKEDSE